MAKPVLRVIIGSTRPGRVGPSVAAWIAERAREHGGFDVQVLADFAGELGRGEVGGQELATFA